MSTRLEMIQRALVDFHIIGSPDFMRRVGRKDVVFPIMVDPQRVEVMVDPKLEAKTGLSPDRWKFLLPLIEGESPSQQRKVLSRKDKGRGYLMSLSFDRRPREITRYLLEKGPPYDHVVLSLREFHWSRKEIRMLSALEQAYEFAVYSSKEGVYPPLEPEEGERRLVTLFRRHVVADHIDSVEIIRSRILKSSINLGTKRTLDGETYFEGMAIIRGKDFITTRFAFIPQNPKLEVISIAENGHELVNL